MARDMFSSKKLRLEHYLLDIQQKVMSLNSSLGVLSRARSRDLSIIYITSNKYRGNISISMLMGNSPGLEKMLFHARLILILIHLLKAHHGNMKNNNNNTNTSNADHSSILRCYIENLGTLTHRMNYAPSGHTYYG
jgi:hypothetical protein